MALMVQVSRGRGDAPQPFESGFAFVAYLGVGRWGPEAPFDVVGFH